MNLLFSRRLLFAIIFAGMAAGLVYFFAVQQLLPNADGQMLAFLDSTWGRGQPHPVGFYIEKIDRLALFWGLLWVGLVPTLSVFVSRVSNPASATKLGDLALALLYAGLFFVALVNFGSEQFWYPIEKMMNFAGKPPFLHRVLFIFPAQALAALVPSLPYLYCFLFSQMVAVVLALWAIKRLSALFIHKDLAFIGQFLMFAIWAPTLKYYTFYDIAIIAIYAACLYFLFTERLLPYLVIFTVGTLNHELTLFLIGLSALVLFGKMKLPKLAGLLALQLFLWGAVRFLMFTLLPAKAAWEGGKPALNIHLFLNDPIQMVGVLTPLAIWYAIAATGLRSAPLALRCCVVLLPCLALMTFLVGQFNEARQFDAFIPVVVALIVCSVRERSKAVPPLGKSSSAAYAMAGA